MKKLHILFNQGSVDNNIIKLHLKQLSDDQLKLSDDFEFVRSSSIRQNSNNKKFHKRKILKEK